MHGAPPLIQEVLTPPPCIPLNQRNSAILYIFLGTLMVHCSRFRDPPVWREAVPWLCRTLPQCLQGWLLASLDPQPQLLEPWTGLPERRSHRS